MLYQLGCFRSQTNNVVSKLCPSYYRTYVFVCSDSGFDQDSGEYSCIYGDLSDDDDYGDGYDGTVEDDLYLSSDSESDVDESDSDEEDSEDSDSDTDSDSDSGNAH